MLSYFTDLSFPIKNDCHQHQHFHFGSFCTCLACGCQKICQYLLNTLRKWMKTKKAPTIPDTGFFSKASQNKLSLIQKKKKIRRGSWGGREEVVNPGVIFAWLRIPLGSKNRTFWKRKKKSPAKFNLRGLSEELLTLSPFAGNKVKRNFPGYIFHRLPLLCLYACFPPLCILENNLNLFDGICSRRQSSPCTHFGAVSLVCSPEDFL